MKKKEERIQRALGTFPCIFRLTSKGRKEVKIVEVPRPRGLNNDAMTFLLALIRLDDAQECTSKKVFLRLYNEMESGPRKHLAMSKAWDRAIEDKLIKEYRRR